MKIDVDQSRYSPINKAEIKRPREAEETLDQKKLRLHQATKEFESFFILQMLKDMRKTIPKSELTDGGLGQDIYTSMFDEQMARNMSGSSTNSLADVLYRSLEKHLEATAVAESGALTDYETPTGIDGLRGIGQKTEPIAAPRHEPAVMPVSEPAVKTSEEKKTEKPVSVRPIGNASGTKPKVSTDPVLSKYGTSINKAAKAYRVDPRLIYSVIMTESSGRADAVSPKGAKGLMQLLDGTAADLGVVDSLNAHQNIMGGTRYLRQLLDKFEGNTRLALAAYNAGPSTVSKYNGVPPYPETRRYISEVLDRLHSARKP